MVAKTNAIYLGYEDYEKCDEYGVIVKKAYFQFLTYDVESSTGITRARVLGCSATHGSEKYNDLMSNVPEKLERCVLDLDIYINPVTNVAQTPKIVRVCEV